MKKRMMTMLLAVSLAVGMENGLVLAAGDKAEAAGMEENGKEVLEETAARSGEAGLIAEGECGENLTYQLDADGVLQINGTGDMYSYVSWGEKQAPWYENAKAVKEVLIGGGVTSIGSSAFAYCSNLTSVTIPEGITSIGYGAFYNCSSLTSVTIPKGAASIGDCAFEECDKLKSVTIPESVTSIGYKAFNGCIALTSVTIPEGVTSIGYGAFYRCGRLATVEIPKGVTSIEYGTFDSCSSLTRVEIPKGVTSIDKYAFNSCSSLENVTIPESVTTIGVFAFCGCSSLKSVKIPEGVTEISADVFKGCSSLESVTIPEKVTSIGKYAFEGCSSLKSVTIPKGVTTIAGYAFNSCSSLESMELPEGVTSIGSYVFKGCSSLTRVEIPKSVTTIGSDAFKGCTLLKDVYYTGSKEDFLEKAFDKLFVGLDVTIHYNPTDIPEECPHSTKKIINKKEATCTEPGYSGDTVCSDCGAIIKKGTVIAAGHKIVVDKAVPATCTKAGKTEGSHCSVCNKVLKAQQTIPAKGHTYKTTTTPATLANDGSIVTKCTVCGYKKTPKTIYRPKTIKLSKTTCTYNGKNQKPAITVKDSQGKTISSSYYTVSYTNCKNVGEATATITFKGNYRGTKKLTYEIAPKNTSSLQVGAKSKGFTVKWKKQSSQTTGYQIQYSTSSKFNGAKTMTIKNNRTTSYTAKKLKAGQKYYVRIRTYKRAKVGGTYQNIYSTWSKAKTVTAKK